MPECSRGEGWGERGGTCAGSEQYGTEKERQSRVKPLPVGSWLVGMPAWPPTLPWAPPPPHCNCHPSCCPERPGVSSMAQLSAGGNPGPRVTDEEISRRGAKTHPSPHSKPQQKLALAEGDGLGAIGSPPPPLLRPSGQAFSRPRAQEEHHLAGAGAGPVLGQGRP